MSDPFGDSDGAVSGAVDYHSNARRAWIAARAAIDVGHEVCHCVNALVTTMRDRFPGVKMLTGFPHTSFVVPVRAFAAPVDVPVGKWKEFDLPFY